MALPDKHHPLITIFWVVGTSFISRGSSQTQTLSCLPVFQRLRNLNYCRYHSIIESPLRCALFVAGVVSARGSPLFRSSTDNQGPQSGMFQAACHCVHPRRTSTRVLQSRSSSSDIRSIEASLEACWLTFAHCHCLPHTKRAEAVPQVVAGISLFRFRKALQSSEDPWWGLSIHGGGD